MSLRNRARSLQRKTGLGYQQALGRLRALGEAPARLAGETGWPLDVCDRYLVDGHAPIDVVEVARRPLTKHELIVAVCEELRRSSAARAVVVTVARGIVAHVGDLDLVAVVAAAAVRPRGEIWVQDDGITLYHAPLARGVLVVKFHRDESSLGLVRLRARAAVEELDRLFAEAGGSDLPPVGGRGGPGGLPAEVRVVAPAAAPEAPARKRKKG